MPPARDILALNACVNQNVELQLARIACKTRYVQKAKSQTTNLQGILLAFDQSQLKPGLTHHSLRSVVARQSNG
jgi:hypothetical protein